jgi:catechol 2,3-dioxygenase-like lactoylglutathione lyase family enzyme
MAYRLHHVQIAVPPGSEEVARRFYVGVLGMEEVDKPPALGPRGGLWLCLAGAELHLGVEAEFRPAAKAHPAYGVPDLDGLQERLRSAGVPWEDDHLLPGRRRCHAHDPFGNRLEFVAEVPP